MEPAQRRSTASGGSCYRWHRAPRRLPSLRTINHRNAADRPFARRHPSGCHWRPASCSERSRFLAFLPAICRLERIARLTESSPLTIRHLGLSVCIFRLSPLNIGNCVRSVGVRLMRLLADLGRSRRQNEPARACLLASDRRAKLSSGVQPTPGQHGDKNLVCRSDFVRSPRCCF